MGDLKKTLKIESVDKSLKTKLILTHSGGTFGTLRFNENSLFITLLGFTANWDCKPTKAIHVDSPGVYTNEKIVNSSTIDEIHFKRDVFDGSVVNGLGHSLLYSFASDKPPVYKVFREPETRNDTP